MIISVKLSALPPSNTPSPTLFLNLHSPNSSSSVASP